MKKLLLSTLAAVSIAVVLPVSAFAATTSTVTGTITNGSGSPLSGASVTITCAGRVTTTVTSGPPHAAGAYSSADTGEFSTQKCHSGSSVSVTATLDGQTGMNTGNINSSDAATVSVQIAGIVSVPELGALTGAGAAILGGAAFMVVRRKHLNQN